MKFRDKRRRPVLTLPRKEDGPIKPMSVPELVAEIRFCEDQIERIKGRILAAVHVKTGDIVEINFGGSLGKKMLVSSIEVSEFDGVWRITAQGAALTTDGQPGSRRGIHTFDLEE